MQLSPWTGWRLLSGSDVQECTNYLLFLCREYANFRVSSDGEVQGVGLLIAADPTSGKLVVLAPIQGGPADRAGIKPGDEVSSHHSSLQICMLSNFLIELSCGLCISTGHNQRTVCRSSASMELPQRAGMETGQPSPCGGPRARLSW